MRIASERHQNISAVALANKTVRIAWAMIAKGSDYQLELVASRVTKRSAYQGVVSNHDCKTNR